MRHLRWIVASSWAPWALLALAVLAQVGATLAGADPYKMIDLSVYIDSVGWAFDGSLYDATSNSISGSGKPVNLPFTYPPFSAVLFTPLAALNLTVARIAWQLASLAALALIIYFTLHLMGRAGKDAAKPVAHLRGVLITATACASWLEPVRTTFNYGQINVFLAALLLAGAVTAKQWWAGSSVGIAAGIKLVPAITGLYYLMQRRWLAALWCVLGFASTVGFAAIFLPSETKRYFTELIFDPARTGPIFGAINQSWRGALARLAGQDDLPTGWIVAVVSTAALAIWALMRALKAQDRTAAFLVVQFLGLLVSPISWSHHYVWIVPLLMWCFFGPHSRKRAVRILAMSWLIAAYSYVVSILVAQPNNYEISSRPGWASGLALIYVVLGMATIGVLGWVNRGVASAAAPSEAGAAARTR
ncbi:DUF2029 domain-containing protein [Nakamurella antarctica]|uniref:DUF2029 domain-containing protein n=1 Tax=Nakamurella antarctica TaxID=1902245 RepID=A0A3G8ZKR7_9ACTN|nr:glycosyltransferase 87 family protein [Nakamurella antarctica]AZI57435.1 DUF2029 domain-containing protein [Nakamurella antarctica]